MNTYDPADSIVYVHMALESARVRSHPSAGEAESRRHHPAEPWRPTMTGRVRQVAALAIRSPDAPGPIGCPDPSERR